MMLYVYSIAEQAVTAAAPIEFTSTGLQRGKYVVQTTDTTTTINCPGLYLVSFNGTAAASDVAQLYMNGEAVPGALAEGTSLAFTALVRVSPNCCAITTNLPARLQVISESAATLSNVALTILKVG